MSRFHRTESRSVGAEESQCVSVDLDTFEPIPEEDTVGTSLSRISASRMPVNETQPLGGPKYYIAANTRVGRTRVIHEAMPTSDVDAGTVSEEMGYEIIEWDLVRDVRGVRESSSPESSAGCCVFEMAAGEEDDDNSMITDGTSSSESTEDDVTMQSDRSGRMDPFKLVARVPAARSFRRPRWSTAADR